MISTPINLRFSDFDMGGHAHNAAYLNYFESARIGFFMSALAQKWDWRKDGIIIKKNTIDYHIPTFIDDKINVEVACNHIGNKSFTLTYTVKDQKDNTKAYGESIVVCFDYIQNKTIEIPQHIKNVLEAHFIG